MATVKCCFKASKCGAHRKKAQGSKSKATKAKKSRNNSTAPPGEPAFRLGIATRAAKRSFPPPVAQPARRPKKSKK